MSRQVHISGLNADGVTAMLAYLRLMGHIPAEVLIFFNGNPITIDKVRAELDKLPGKTFCSGTEDDMVDVTPMRSSYKQFVMGRKKLWVESE